MTVTQAITDWTSLPGRGYVLVEWTSQGRHADWYGYRVYMREVGQPDWRLAYETVENKTNYTYHLWQFAARVPQEFVVVEIIRVGVGQPTELAFGPATSITPEADDTYWLIHPTDETLTCRIEHVTSDNLSDEHEFEIIELIGRGRSIDRGSNFGVTGSLDVELRPMGDGTTARVQRRSLEALATATETLWLRNPFGDIYSVALGDLRFERVAGTGTSEHLTGTIEIIGVAE